MSGFIGPFGETESIKLPRFLGIAVGVIAIGGGGFIYQDAIQRALHTQKLEKTHEIASPAALDHRYNAFGQGVAGVILIGFGGGVGISFLPKKAQSA